MSTSAGPAEAIPAPVATRPGDTVDAHMHLFTVRVMEEMAERFPESVRFASAVKDRKWGRRGEKMSLPDLDASAMVSWYVRRLADNGVAKGVVVSTTPDSVYIREFAQLAVGHIAVLTTMDPRDPASVGLLEREIEAGYRGVKLYPVNRCFHLSDPACKPFFAKAAELGVPFIVHYGVTVDPFGDLRYADPIDLSPVARDMPENKFVIAHFGAGYLDQVLKLAYQCKNVCVDTSGTNNWMDHHFPPVDLPTVFRSALTALGPERILFGTDAGTTAPYRAWIKFQQRRVMEELGVREGDIDLVMRGNAVDIFGLDNEGWGA